MSRQDADDDTASGSGDGEDERETAEESAAASTSEQEQVEPESPGEEPLEEIAEEPAEDTEAALSALVSETIAETSVDHEEIEVEEEFAEEIADLSTTETAQLVAALQAEVDDLGRSLAEERERADDVESRLARKQADFQNYKERQEREKERIREQAAEEVVERFVGVRDNLVRALEQDEDADIRSGVESTLDLFDEELEREGVSVIDPEAGEKPDPRRHEVLANVAGEQPSGTVAETHRPGYETEDSVIRPAQVAVSDGSLREESSEVDQQEEGSEAEQTADTGEAAQAEESSEGDSASQDDGE